MLSEEQVATGPGCDLSEVESIALKLEALLADLDAHSLHIPAAHLQAALDSLRSQ